MYSNVAGITTIIYLILSVLVLITFFVMAFRLRKIMETMSTLKEIELKKPSNQIEKKCPKCDGSYKISVLEGKVLTCPHCKTVEIYD